jgi:hypothetical protein
LGASHGPNSGEALLHQGLFSYMKVCQRKKRKNKIEVIFEILFPKLKKLINIDIF